MRDRGLQALIPLLFLSSLSGSCGVDKFPLPESFDVAFAVGKVCIPTEVATGEASMTYPVRFDLCRYRCIDLERSTARLHAVHTCALGSCRMVLMATVTAHSKLEEKNCDARDLIDPPPSECEAERFDFFLPVPLLDGEPVRAETSVHIPFLQLEEGQHVIDRLNDGDDPNTVILEEVGYLGPPERELTIRFGDEYEPLVSHDDFAATDCHPIELPQ